MNQRSLIKQVTLYRYRYIIGGLLLIGLLTGLLVGRLDLAPTGLSPAAIDSAIISANLSLADILKSSLIDLPYHLLQRLGIDLFGVFSWSIALPSVIIAIFSGITFAFMIRGWFRSNIAIITSLMLVTSAPFLTLGRSGMPEIMLLFWLSLILLAATNILHNSKFTTTWQIIGVLAVGFSLYTPLMIYPLLALTMAGLLHPHVRYIIKKLSPLQLGLAAALFLIVIAPLVVSIVTGSSDISQLVGISNDSLDLQTVLANLVFSLKTGFGFNISIIGDLPRPFFIVPVTALAILGLVKTAIDNHAARSYMIILWLILIIAPLMLHPTNLYAALIPVFLLVAIGIEIVIHEWYKLFPLNPYARIVGLIPLGAILILIMLTGLFQYYYGHFYGESNTVYHRTLAPTRQVLDARDQPTMLITSPELKPFYEILEREYPKLEVTDQSLTDDSAPKQTIIHDEAEQQPDAKVYRIITSDHADARELLRVYRPQ